MSEGRNEIEHLPPFPESAYPPGAVDIPVECLCDPDCSWTGVDGTDVADPEKAWRCDGCGATGTSATLNRPAAHIGSRDGSDV